MISKVQWKGQPAHRFSNGKSEIVVPSGFGPRVLFGAPRGRPNLFLEIDKESPPNSDSPKFLLYGGHRLWHAPEHSVRSYQPDNDAPVVEKLRGTQGLRFICPPEAATGIRKIVAIEVKSWGFRVTHTLVNHGLWPVEVAPWALTMLRGGVGVVPLPERTRHSASDLLPKFAVVPWTYTDLSLPCWRFQSSFIGVDVAAAPKAQKLGLTAYPGWSACWLDGDVFVKRAPVTAGAKYPDLGCAFETYTNGRMIELETLGPLETLAPGAQVSHPEDWGFLTDIPKPDSEHAFVQGLRPAVQAWLASLESGD